MTSNQNLVRQEIAQGIKAHKAGNNSVAWLHFQAALREEPRNVNVLLWLAYLAPEYEKQVFLLNRVLEIDPENVRAQAGLAWAEQKYSAAQEADETAVQAETTDKSVTATPEEVAKLRQTLRDTSDTSELKVKAQKGTIAQRARRRISPLIALLVVGSLLAGASILGLAALAPSISRAEQPGALPQVIAEAPPMTTPEPSPTPPPPINTPAPLATPTSMPTVTPLPPTPLPTPTPVPLAYQPASPAEKWIEVDLSDQQVTAWEGELPVMNFTASTGLPNTPTLVGQFQIYQKFSATRMMGPGYDLPGVPFTMYYDRGYALHGAYWHDNFGQPMSHGCINLSPAEAEQLFGWAGPHLPEGASQVAATIDNPGTLVVVHE